MKECPKCGTLYTDETLSFCLSDGTPLFAQTTGAKTEEFSNVSVDTKTNDIILNQTQSSNQQTAETVLRTNQKSNKKGVRSFWIFATFGLFGILLLGILGVWFVSDKLTDNKIITENNSLQTNENLNSLPQNLNENSQEISVNENLENAIEPKNIEQPTIKPKENPTQIPVIKPTANPTVKPTSKPTPVPTKTPLGERSFRVIGVRSNDVLYIRPQPGNLKVAVSKIPSNATGIKVLGTKQIGKSRWALVNYNGSRGWINSKFLAREN